jgi:hypothetical protein
MTLVAISKDPHPIMVDAVCSFTPTSFGCHCAIINSVSMHLSQPPMINGSYGAPKTWEELQRFVRVHKMAQIPKEVDTYEKYVAQLPKGYNYQSKHLTVDMLPELPDLSAVWKEKEPDLGMHPCVIFAPIINYGKPSRDGGATGKEGGYRAAATDQLVKWLMKNKGGSWWGMPVMRNVNHHEKYGSDTSLFQVVVWNRFATSEKERTAGYGGIAQMFKNTQFQLHDKGAGQYGPLLSVKEYLQIPKVQGKAFADKPEEELEKMTYHSLKQVSEEVKASRAKPSAGEKAAASK